MRLCCRSAPAFSLSSRQKIRRGVATPAGPDYAPNAKAVLRRAPAFSLSGRSDCNQSGSGPGPADYEPDYGQVLEAAPAFTLKGRHEGDGGCSGPGPADYTIRSERSSGGITMGARERMSLEIPRWAREGQ